MVGKIFFWIGLALLGGAYLFYLDTRNFLETASAADGKVIELEYTPRSGSGDDASGDVYNPIVSFRAADGGEYKFRHNIGSNPASFSVGEKVAVLYDPASPTDSGKIDTFFSLYLATIILGFMGAIFTAVGTLASRMPRVKYQGTVALPQKTPEPEQEAVVEERTKESSVLERSRPTSSSTVERD